MRRIRSLLGWAALLALSCGSPTGVDGSAGTQVAAVSLDVTATTVVVGTETPLHAAVIDVDGNVVPNAQVVWSVRDANIAAVSAVGVVTGLAAGSTQVAASAGGRSATVNVTVQPPPVASVTVTPTPLSVTVGQTGQLTAVARDGRGVALTDRAIAWSSENAAVATVSPTGLVTAASVGATTVTASSEGKAVSIVVTVTPPPVAVVVVQPDPAAVAVGQTATLQATLRDAGGAVLVDRVVSWTSSSDAVARVSAAGVVTGIAPGKATITATSEGISGTSVVTVTVLAVATVTIAPEAPSLVVRENATLSATLRDANGAVLADRPVTWSSSAAAVATVTASGLVTAVAPGTAVITASSEGKSGTTTITVVRAPVLTLTLAPTTLDLAIGQNRPLTATVEDANHVIVTDRDVKWTSSAELVASVSATGVVTGRAVGTATITATSEGKSASALATVSAAAVGTVVVQPGTASLVVGGTTPLTAVVTDVNGAPAPERAVTWTSSNSSVATVDQATGVVRAAGPGTATITAASEGKTGTATVTVTAAPAASVTVEPATATVQVGRTTILTATVKDASGNVLAGRAVSWTTNNSAVATVSASGVVTAVAQGGASISATVEGRTASAAVTVTLVPVGGVAVQPKTASLFVGGTTTLGAVVTDANGAVTNRVVTWSSDNLPVATVSPNGVVTAVAPGQATITATSEGKTDIAVVTVSRAPVGSVVVLPASGGLTIGQTLALGATVTDTRGVVVTDRLVTWTSSNDLVATVSGAGVVTALSVGSATITATSEGKSGSASVSVAAVPVASVTVQPTTASLFVGQTTVLLATVRDANGTVVTDRPITWSSSNTAVATVSATGVVTAVAPGSATVSASAGGRSGSAGIVVTLVPVGSVVLAPPTATVIAGETTTLVPTIRDANGAVVANRAVSWTTSNSAVATVSSSGVVTAVAPGDATITATSEGKSGNATITVIPVPVGSVVVAPATRSVVAGTTTTLTATVRDANGTLVTNRPVAWSTSDPLIATVSSTGVVTGVAPGSATVTATSEGKSGSSAITVTPAPVANVTVQPPAFTLPVGGTTTVSAVLKDANGNVLTGRVVTWVSSNPLLATVSASGLVTAVAATGAGPVFITASSEGRNGSSAVTVTKVPVGSVTLPGTATLVAGESTTLVPVVTDANGTVVTDRVVTWSSSNTSVATVSPAGVVRSLITGSATITATSEGQSASTALSVTPAPVGTVTIAPSATTIGSGSTVTLAATVKDVNGTTVTDRTVTWKSSDDLVAIVSTSGAVTGLKAGTATITATSEGKSGTATITVVPGPAATVAVTPAAATVKDGTLVQLTATAVDANGNAITGRTFTWGSSDTAIATVSTSGRVTTKRSGVVTITATLDGKRDMSQITVTP
jgi:uncharacterized protein YjdB